MVHFTCDLCGKDLSASGEPRFVVKVEILPGFDPNQVREEDLEDDPMEAVADLIRRDEDAGADGAEAEAIPRGFRFDLCPKCRSKFLKDPLNRETVRSFDFSQN